MGGKGPRRALADPIVSANLSGTGPTPAYIPARGPACGFCWGEYPDEAPRLAGRRRPSCACHARGRAVGERGHRGARAPVDLGRGQADRGAGRPRPDRGVRRTLCRSAGAAGQAGRAEGGAAVGDQRGGARFQLQAAQFRRAQCLRGPGRLCLHHARSARPDEQRGRAGLRARPRDRSHRRAPYRPTPEGHPAQRAAGHAGPDAAGRRAGQRGDGTDRRAAWPGRHPAAGGRQRHVAFAQGRIRGR